ncbi:Methyltransf_21 domain-containing protein [Durusdinium trenchii]|uniref:Methyltransf_21 domain-containing protein n=1 Tax=Durusdinium trenchii TaxID=1381693 RepID=A0ABP0R7T6_9DINO
MDSRRIGLLLILLFGVSLVAWNLRTISGSQEVGAAMVEPKDGFEKLTAGQSLAFESMTPELKTRVEPLTDAVVLRSWAAPHWLHVVSGSGRDPATRELRSKKLRECPLTLLMQWVFDEGCAQQHSVVIDIGMNLGWFTALAAAHGLQVVAVEPSATKVQYMAKTLELNGWGELVQLRHGALADGGGKLFVDEARWWEKRSASREGGDGKTQAEAIRLDDLVLSDTKVCLLKADCRGCETEAFRSGEQLLKAGAIQVVQMEYDNSMASQAALETLQSMSPRPWQCILLPTGISCSGADLADKQGEALKELWDFVVGNVHEDCSASTLRELSPPDAHGYHTDLWLVHDHTMDRLRAEPNFVAAQQRLAEAQSQKCEYAEQQVEPGVCELMCHRFSNIEEAKEACSARPTCTKVLAVSSGFELRGGAAFAGPMQVPATIKLHCS